jgi:DNA-binding CsgD family transcriptional regulator
MAFDSTYADLIGALYDAPLGGPAGWTAALERLTQAFRGSTACLVQQDMSRFAGSAVTYGTDGRFHQSYFDYYAKRNVLWRSLSRVAPGTVFSEHDVLGKEAFLKSEFYNDWLRPQDVFATVACKLAGDCGAPVATVVSIQRPRSAGEFDSADIRLVHMLLPHLQRAGRINERLASEVSARDGTAEALDMLRHGVVLVTADARVCLANRRAEEILGANDGLTVIRQRLAASLATETTPLRRLVWRVAQNPADSGSLPISRPSGQRALQVFVVPLRQQRAATVAGPRPQAIVFITDAEHVELPPYRFLRDSYGLTRGEIAVIHEMLRGSDAQGAADKLGLALPTVRSHLRNAYRKTGTSRQSDLIGLLTRGFALRIGH